MSPMHFRVNPHYISAWFSRNSLFKSDIKSDVLSDCKKTETHNHLLCKQTLNHLAKMTKWLSYVVSNYLYGVFDSIFVLCHIHVLEWILTPWLPECQETPSRNRSKIWSLSDITRPEPTTTRLSGHLWTKQLWVCEFKSCWSHLNFRFQTCFKQGVPCQSNIYRL